MKTIWLFLCRLGTFLYLQLHIYKIWSNIYRFFRERRFRDIPLRHFSDLKDLGKYLSENSGKWTADKWEQLFDAVSYPSKAQEVFDDKFKPTSGFDCDDYAIYITNVLERSLAIATMPAASTAIPVADPRFFTVTWLEGWKPGGHNTCLVKTPDGRFAYMDYGMPTGHATTPGSVARNIIDAYASKEAASIVWSISKGDLTPLEVHWG